MEKELLYVENLVTNRSFGQNLDYISFPLNRGEIFGITALNGDGLSTLADVLTGRLKPSGGRVFVDGEEVSVYSPERAARLGIQEIREGDALIPHMSVAENLSMLRPVSGGRLIRRPRKNEEVAREFLERYGVRCSPEVMAQKLTYLQRTEILICRALLSGARILICSEAGAGFSERDQQEFQRFLRDVCGEGVSLIFMNSDAKLTLRFAGRIAVMRSGMLCYQRKKEEADYSEILRHMRSLRRPLSISSPDAAWRENEMALQNCRVGGTDGRAISLKLQGGKSSGLLWNLKGGEDAVYRMFSGTMPVRGTVTEGGRQVRFSRWRRENAGNIYCLRKRFWSDGLYQNMTVGENISLRTFRRFGYRGGVLNPSMIRLALEEFCISHEIDPDCLGRSPRHLDWELRNKIVLLGVMFAPPRLLVLDNPLYAIDEDTKHNLLHSIEHLKSGNTAILWCASEKNMLCDFCETVTQAL